MFMPAGDPMARPLTVGHSSFDNTYQPWGPQRGSATGLTVTNQWTCSDNTHVWPCEHAEVCRCGRATRKPEPKKCFGCGK